MNKIIIRAKVWTAKRTIIAGNGASNALNLSLKFTCKNTTHIPVKYELTDPCIIGVGTHTKLRRALSSTEASVFF